MMGQYSDQEKSVPCASKLHKNLSLRKWHVAADDLLTEEGQRAVRETYKNEYPLLIACERNAPSSLILSLLRDFPEAASKQSRSGNLPLHHACQIRASIDVIHALIEAYPEGLDTQNNMQITPRYYRQKDPNAKELVTRPTMCWVKQMQQNTMNQQKLEKLASLREMKWELRNELENYKKRLNSMGAQVDETELLANSLRLYEEKVKFIQEYMESLKEKTTVRKNILRKDINLIEKILHEEQMSCEEKREESKYQCEFVEQAVKKMHELHRDIDASSDIMRMIRM